MCILNINSCPLCSYVLKRSQNTAYNYAYLCIHTPNLMQRSIWFYVYVDNLFGFLSCQTTSGASSGSMTAYTFGLLFMYRRPNQMSGWVSKDIKSVVFFSIHRTQLHLNKPTPRERLAPTENTTQPQTLKLNHSCKFRSHQHIVKNSL